MARTRKQPAPDPLIQDIVAVGLITLGIVLLVGIIAPNSGAFPRFVGALLRSVVGLGAFIVPALFVFVGAILLAGSQRTTTANAIVGFAILFVAFISGCQFIHTPNLREFVSGETMPILDIHRGGGYLGLSIAYVLERVFGRVCSYVLLTGAMIVAMILITGVPFMAFVAPVLGLFQGRDEKTSRRKVAGLDERKARRLASAEEDNTPRAEPLSILKRRLLGGAEDEQTRGDILVKIPKPGPPSRPAPRQPAAHSGSEFVLPPVTLLSEPPPPPKRIESELKYKIEIIERTLEEFKIEADVVEIAHGPTVTRYEIQLAPGIKVNKIVSLADNLAMALAAIDVRVEAPIPGKSAIGVEVPNSNPAIVALREVIDTEQFWNAPTKLTFALGKDVSGEPKYADLTKMPHMLIAGATNAGKSVCLNSLIASLLFRATPREVKFILIDPKRVELSLFDGIPHLASPVVKDARQAAGILRSSLKEMEHRYDLFVKVGARNFDSYNAKVKPEQRMPYLVIVVDELADLMMQAAPEVEFCICRLAQLARATGIHLVIATQRPSVDVITGTIKANISSRISFAVTSHIDSRTILDGNGAERLIGRGDMLFKPIDASKPTRIQGCWISEKETEDLVKYLKDQETPDYTIEAVQIGDGTKGAVGQEDVMADEIYEPAVRLVVSNGYASTSMIQRKFRIGYTRAARLVDAMEDQGLVGPPDGAKPREVLIGIDELDRLFGTPMFGEPLDDVEPDDDYVESDDEEREDD
ncbi:MAG: DNA translocase FtsK 4TM domain-containing protein [Armatimonadetes bacterium]|nr:DNA translocase FtsK 4TM domain-containing protein [Armatimonadota bacterium]